MEGMVVREEFMADMEGIVGDMEDMVDMEVAMVKEGMEGDMDISYTIFYLTLLLFHRLCIALF